MAFLHPLWNFRYLQQVPFYLNSKFASHINLAYFFKSNKPTFQKKKKTKQSNNNTTLRPGRDTVCSPLPPQNALCYFDR
ncbi:hypothetical protein MOSE0_K03400 [Monosporozyma servazzii]